MPFLHFEDERQRAKPMTESKLFAKIDFKKMNDPKLSKTIDFKIKETGEVNAIRILTSTELLKGIVLGECEAYCPVLIVRIPW